MSDEIDDLGRRLAAEFPVAAQHRGWTVANLRHNYEQTPFGVEESWSCDIIGPRDLWVERKRFVGGKSAFVWGIQSDAMGTAESTTADGLLDQVRAIVDALGVRALRAPRPVVSKPIVTQIGSREP